MELGVLPLPTSNVELYIPEESQILELLPPVLFGDRAFPAVLVLARNDYLFKTVYVSSVILPASGSRLPIPEKSIFLGSAVVQGVLRAFFVVRALDPLLAHTISRVSWEDQTKSDQQSGSVSKLQRGFYWMRPAGTNSLPEIVEYVGNGHVYCTGDPSIHSLEDFEILSSVLVAPPLKGST